MGTLYDAVDVNAIPKDAEIVAGYVDGNWPTYDALVKAFPNARHVSITVEGQAGARTGDLEDGNFGGGAAEAICARGAEWAKGEIAAGRRPTLYYPRSWAGLVSAALKAAGVAVSAVDYWVADWTGAAHVVPGSVATQWASPATGSGGNFDISETVGTWPPPAVVPSPPAPEPVPPIPTPTPGPAPSPTEETIVNNALATWERTNPGGTVQRHVLWYSGADLVHSYQSVEGPDFTWHSEKIPVPA